MAAGMGPAHKQREGNSGYWIVSLGRAVQLRATKVMKGLGSLPCEERLRELGLLSLFFSRLSEDLITMFQYLNSGYKEDEESLFTRRHMEKMRGKEHKLLLGTFQLDTREKFFTMRAISCWNNLPRKVMDSPALDAWDLAGQGAGPSGLDGAFAKKGWTR